MVLLLLLALFFSGHKLQAAGFPPVDYLGIENGLSNNAVTCIYQDHKGFMWFGTYDGLNRYDGYGFKVFRRKLNDTGSLVNNWIVTISEDDQNNLWVGAKEGISIYNPLNSKLSSVYYLPYGKKEKQKITFDINTIRINAKGTVFIGTANGGLLVNKKGADAAFQVPFVNGSGTKLNYKVQDLSIDAQNQVWLFIQKVGLCLYDENTKAIRLVNSRIKSGDCLKADNRGNLWMGSEDGLYQYMIAKDTFTVFNEESGKLTSNLVADICLAKDGTIWIATDGGGVNILDPATGKIEYLMPDKEKKSLTSASVWAVYEDNESRKWIGTLRGGINIIDHQKDRFQTISHNPLSSNSLVNNFALSFAEEPGGNLWIGTDGGGLSYWDRGRNTFTNFTHVAGSPGSLSSNFVTRLLCDFQKDIWVATYDRGLSRYDRRSKSFVRYPCFDGTVENRYIWSLYEDRDKKLWVGTINGGKLYQFNRETDRFEVFDRRLENVISLSEDRTGQLWAGTFSDLVRVDKKNKNHTIYQVSNSIRSQFEDRAGNFWLGTEGEGLVLFDRKQGKIAARYTEAEGLCNNAVLNILEDDSGYLWLSTFNGLSRFDPVKKTFKNFFLEDGLQSNQFLYNAALKLRTGELAFGGIKGFNIFHPDSIRPISNQPPVYFTGLKINNKAVDKESPYVVSTGPDRIEAVKVPYNESVIAFDFAALEYSEPNKISYAYYLEGWDKGWNYTGNLRSAIYTHLEEGNYTLRVKATNAEGKWSNEELTLKVTVLPPWYRTWWAYLIYISIGAYLIYLFWLYETRQAKLRYKVLLADLNAEKKKAELEIEKMEREKAQAEYQKEKAERETERVLVEKEKEVNEKRLSFFTNISHEFRTPLTLIINPVKDLLQKSRQEHKGDSAELNTVYRNARRLISLVDQLLLFRKADTEADKLKLTKLNFCNLCREVYLYFVQQAKARKIQYDLECDNEELALYGDREKLEIILYNLISNALKYTPEGGKVTLSVGETDSSVEVRVSDTGQGVPADVGDKLFEKFYQVQEKGVPSKLGFGIGLYLVKHFVESHKGRVSYESEQGRGTTFFVKLQKGKEHFDNPVIFEDAATESFLPEYHPEHTEEAIPKKEKPKLDVLVNDRQSLLVVDDNTQIRQYIAQVFKDKYTIYEANNGDDGLQVAIQYAPDMIISDVRMPGMNGLEMCKNIKENPSTSHIPVILLTGSDLTHEKKLLGVESGADDYITKPFEKDLLVARVTNILKSRTQLQKYFYNEVTLQKNTLKISAEFKEFLDKCIAVVEHHIDDENFNIQKMASEMGMSHSNLYKKVKSVSGQSVSAFIRFIRLRKAAELFINTNSNVNEIAYLVGINDIKYFREQFHKLFGMNPSEYIKKYRKTFGKSFNLNEEVVNPKDSE